MSVMPGTVISIATVIRAAARNISELAATESRVLMRAAIVGRLEGAGRDGRGVTEAGDDREHAFARRGIGQRSHHARRSSACVDRGGHHGACSAFPTPRPVQRSAVNACWRWPARVAISLRKAQLCNDVHGTGPDGLTAASTASTRSRHRLERGARAVRACRSR